MAFKSATQPLCRYCGAPIAKQTTSVVFPYGTDGKSRPVDREAAQRVINERIISLRYTGSPGDSDRRVFSVNVWDGESYEDEFFCKLIHAEHFARLYARAGKVTVAYNEAWAKQQAAAGVPAG